MKSKFKIYFDKFCFILFVFSFILGFEEKYYNNQMNENNPFFRTKFSRLKNLKTQPEDDDQHN
jgi:hypothetical protein